MAFLRLQSCCSTGAWSAVARLIADKLEGWHNVQTARSVCHRFLAHRSCRSKYIHYTRVYIRCRRAIGSITTNQARQGITAALGSVRANPVRDLCGVRNDKERCTVPGASECDQRGVLPWQEPHRRAARSPALCLVHPAAVRLLFHCVLGVDVAPT
jgi:hypothetical protein